MASVTLTDLLKLYPRKSGSGVPAVDGISLTIADGEFMVLVGPSGCGKSTTLRMIAGLEEISGGTIRIDDTVVNDVLPKDRDIAMVFQNYALYPHMSVYDNMAFGLKLRKLPAAEIDQRVRSAATLLGLSDFLARRPKTLSGGQRQRVAVGRAIVRQPKVFLFDEPLSNLDAKMRAAMRTELVRLHARLRTTMIYVTHDQVEAMTMGHRICVMHEGRIQQVAAPLELYNHPANLYVAGFIGSPPMGLFRGTLQAGGDSLRFIEDNPSGPAISLPLGPALSGKFAPHADKAIVLGVRPEHIHAIAPSDTPGAEPTAEVVVEIAEPMGAETFLHLTSGAHSFVARVVPTSSFAPNERLRIAFDLTGAHFFDAISGQNLR